MSFFIPNPENSESTVDIRKALAQEAADEDKVQKLEANSSSLIS